MALDPHFKAMFDEQARGAPAGGGPPISAIAPAVAVRAALA
jgi:hypothetical protein